LSDIFVSYKAEDRQRVRPLVDALETDGFSVWWDPQITAGSEWREDIQTQLDSASCVIVVWSRRSVGRHGRFVRDEAARAQRNGTYLPIRIDRVEPPLGFGEVQACSLHGWKGDRGHDDYQAVLRAVRRIISGQAPEQARVERRATVSRRTVLIGGSGTAIAAVAAFSAWALFRPRQANAANSIAVLPFANLSGDPAQAYFSDGMAEELRSALARLDGLKVAGRISSEAVRDEDARTIARRLKVATILTGSVRRGAGTLRVASQLIDGRTGLERWSATYDRPEGNVLAVQTDIAQNVVSALSLELGHAGVQALNLGGTASSTAYDLYLQAVAGAQRDDSESSLRDSIALLDAAIAADPRFAKAFAAKSRNLSYLADVGHSPEEIRRGYARAAGAAKRARALAPRLPDGYAALADALYGQGRIAAGTRQVEAGLEVAPNDLQLLQSAVILFVAAGRTSDAVSYADRMVEIDPLNPLSHRRRYYALFYDRQFDAAIEEAKRTLQLAPALVVAPYFIALSLVMTGRYRDAQHYLEIMPKGMTVRLAGEAIVAAKLGDVRASDAFLAELRKSYGDAASYQFAQVYAQRGDADRAFEALDRGFPAGDPGLNTLRVDPLLDPIRGDQRFAAMLSRLDARS
jgi:serine/threonine-protein kinase